MLLPGAGPVSNAERQRQFRARNPGYHRRYYTTRAAWDKHYAAQRHIAEAKAAAELATAPLFAAMFTAVVSPYTYRVTLQPLPQPAPTPALGSPAPATPIPAQLALF